MDYNTFEGLKNNWKNLNMNKIKCSNQSIYHPSKEDQWTNINWSKVDKTIKNLQNRIAKAAKNGEIHRMKNLQRLLTYSISARLKAVQTVTNNKSTNQRQTFITKIDGEILETGENKKDIALELQKNQKVQKSLQLSCRKTKPIKSIRVANINSDRRRHGDLIGNKNKFVQFPSLSDRARLVLWDMALNPYSKKNGEFDSINFSSYLNKLQRHDLFLLNKKIRNLFNKPNSFEWILTIQIDQFLEKVNSDWFLKNIPIKDKKLLKSWLKKKYITGSELFSSDCHLFYNSKLKTTLTKIFFYSLNEEIQNLSFSLISNSDFNVTKQQKHFGINTDFKIFYFSNTLIVIGKRQQQLEYIQKKIIKILKVRGFQVNEKTILLNHISKGFDFFKWNFRKYSNGVLLCKISKNSISKHRKEMKFLTKKIHSPEILIPKMNKKICEWVGYNYFCNDTSKVYSSMNTYIFKCLMKWGRRRHGNKTKRWVFTRYWKHLNGRWTFNTIVKTGEILTLMTYMSPEFKEFSKQSQKIKK